MKKILILAAVAAILSTCADPEQIAREKRDMQSQLPPGCIFLDLGEYRNINRVVAVRCKSDEVTTTSGHIQVGKIGYEFATIAMEDMR